MSQHGNGITKFCGEEVTGLLASHGRLDGSEFVFSIPLTEIFPKHKSGGFVSGYLRCDSASLGKWAALVEAPKGGGSAHRDGSFTVYQIPVNDDYSEVVYAPAGGVRPDGGQIYIVADSFRGEAGKRGAVKYYLGRIAIAYVFPIVALNSWHQIDSEIKNSIISN